ncbi:hypothetical protein M378DRAFT_181369 [Amanita muscaria Koide BX008]|uniref:Ribonucleotide reductase large subunit C-terminal domain-containing protein n=1 Tax=Amanita muscaria (strain Koide BX008) TaxID=946122 RepID=A0A0C2S642_AMAMK|nr:hypothetical protein M378DRAFT_181369 [Amanita muscaria Koide BX008]
MKLLEVSGGEPRLVLNETPGLYEAWGHEFEVLYEKYEKEGHTHKTIPAQKLWYAIFKSQIETGGLFMLYKDSANSQCILVSSSPLICAARSLNTPPLTKWQSATLLRLLFQLLFKMANLTLTSLHEVVKVITCNLNCIIDINYYPIPEARQSNTRHRPIGIGVQGLADTFMALRLFYSTAAQKLNIQIFETIYHSALEASAELAASFLTGQLQYDFWGVMPMDLWDWDALKAKIAKTSLRNSLLTFPMPTAFTSQMLGFNECFEPYTRRVLAGEFQLICPWLLRELVDLGLWDDTMKNIIIAHNGSIQNIPISLTMSKRYTRLF